MGGGEGEAGMRHFLSPAPFDLSFLLVSVLIVRLSYGAMNVLSYTRLMVQNFITFKDSLSIPLRCLASISGSFLHNSDTETVAGRRRRLPILFDKETCIHILPLYQSLSFSLSLSLSLSFSPPAPISTAYVPRPLSPSREK